MAANSILLPFFQVFVPKTWCWSYIFVLYGVLLMVWGGDLTAVDRSSGSCFTFRSTEPAFPGGGSSF